MFDSIYVYKNIIISVENFNATKIYSDDIDVFGDVRMSLKKLINK